MKKKPYVSKKLTKTNPIMRFNNSICHDYRKHRKKAELGSNIESNGYGDGQPKLIHTTDNNPTSRTNIHRDHHKREDRLSVHEPMDHWRNHHHTETRQNPIGRTTANSERGNVEDIDNLHNLSTFVAIPIYYDPLLLNTCPLSADDIRS